MSISITLFLNLKLYFNVRFFVSGYKIELTAEEQAMSYPGQKVDPEESLGSGPGSGIGPGSTSQPQR